jgi:hypothetical protein
MCCSVGCDTLLVRVGSGGRERALASTHVKPMKIGGRTMAGFVRVDPEGFRTEAALAKWIERGIEVGAAARRSRDRPQRGQKRARE